MPGKKWGVGSSGVHIKVSPLLQIFTPGPIENKILKKQWKDEQKKKIPETGCTEGAGLGSAPFGTEPSGCSGAE